LIPFKTPFMNFFLLQAKALQTATAQN
jgi:hypothetical protein